MPKGLPKSIIKQYGITKKAWSVYRGRKKSSSRSSKVTGKVKRRTKSLARRRGRRGSRKFTLPLAPILGLAVGMAKPLDAIVKGNYSWAIEYAAEIYTGYSAANRKWMPELLMRGLLPLVAGVLVHKFVGGAPLNVNRMLASAGVPFIRI